MEIIFPLADIGSAARHFLEQNPDGKVFAFHGEMGAGKTTFITTVCKTLGVNSVVSSPTFSIINQYDSARNGIIYHLDLYRLKDEEETIMAGVEDCYYSGQYCFVEWPEKAPGLLPENTVYCYLTLAGEDERRLTWK